MAITRRLPIKGIYAIVDDLDSFIRLQDYGIELFQFRDKSLRKEDYEKKALLFLKHCSKSSVLILNDHWDVAMNTGIGAVHLGQNDENPALVREKMGKTAVIGLSLRYPTQWTAETDKLVDYYGCGAIRASQTKNEAQVIGWEGFDKLRSLTTRPLAAIGGLLVHDANTAANHQADYICFASALEELSPASVKKIQAQMRA